MSDTLTTVTHLINSPPGQLVAGATLFGFVWRLFKGVDGILSADTKLQVAVWLLDVKTSETFDAWPDICIALFNKLFGERALSIRRIVRALIAFIGGSFFFGLLPFLHPTVNLLSDVEGGVFLLFFLAYDLVADFFSFGLILILMMIVLGYAAVLVTQAALLLLKYVRSLPFRIVVASGCAAISLLGTALLAVCVSVFFVRVGISLGTFDAPVTLTPEAQFYDGLDSLSKVIEHFPILFRNLFDFNSMAGVGAVLFGGIVCPSLLLWVYSVSALLLTLARRFDSGFQWFNSKADIEKQPLSAVGLVAGGLVASAYWVVMIVSSVAHHA